MRGETKVLESCGLASLVGTKADTPRDPVSSRVEGKGEHPRLSSDLLKQAVAYRSMPRRHTGMGHCVECAMKG